MFNLLVDKKVIKDTLNSAMHLESLQISLFFLKKKALRIQQVNFSQCYLISLAMVFISRAVSVHSLVKRYI